MARGLSAVDRAVSRVRREGGSPTRPPSTQADVDALRAAGLSDADVADVPRRVRRGGALLLHGRARRPGGTAGRPDGPDLRARRPGVDGRRPARRRDLSAVRRVAGQPARRRVSRRNPCRDAQAAEDERRDTVRCRPGDLLVDELRLAARVVVSPPPDGATAGRADVSDPVGPPPPRQGDEEGRVGRDHGDRNDVLPDRSGGPGGRALPTPGRTDARPAAGQPG